MRNEDSLWTAACHPAVLSGAAGPQLLALGTTRGGALLSLARSRCGAEAHAHCLPQSCSLTLWCVGRPTALSYLHTKKSDALALAWIPSHPSCLLCGVRNGKLFAYLGCSSRAVPRTSAHVRHKVPDAAWVLRLTQGKTAHP